MEKLLTLPMNLQYFADKQEDEDKDAENAPKEDESDKAEADGKEPEKENANGEERSKETEQEPEKAKESRSTNSSKKDNPSREDKDAERVAGDSELVSLQNQVEQLKEELQSERQQNAQHKEQLKEMEKAVEELVDAKIKGVPEKYAELIPEGDGFSKLNWITKAEGKGLFKQTNPEIEIGRNLDSGKRNSGAEKKELSAYQRMSNIFGQTFKN